MKAKLFSTILIAALVIFGCNKQMEPTAVQTKPVIEGYGSEPHEDLNHQRLVIKNQRDWDKLVEKLDEPILEDLNDVQFNFREEMVIVAFDSRGTCCSAKWDVNVIEHSDKISVNLELSSGGALLAFSHPYIFFTIPKSCKEVEFN